MRPFAPVSLRPGQAALLASVASHGRKPLSPQTAFTGSLLPAPTNPGDIAAPQSFGWSHNSSFKPTPHRGVNSVLYATLHAVATPPWGGLTPALGGRKAVDCFACQCSLSLLRLALLFGRVPAALLLRSSPCGALTQRMRCVGRLRKRCLVAVSIPRLRLSLRLHPAVNSRVRVRASPPSYSASAQGLDSHRYPPPPNNSFKPTPCRGVGRVLCATLAHVRRPATGRLNSGVRHQWKAIYQLSKCPSFGATSMPVAGPVAATRASTLWTEMPLQQYRPKMAWQSSFGVGTRHTPSLAASQRSSTSH